MFESAKKKMAAEIDRTVMLSVFRNIWSAWQQAYGAVALPLQIVTLRALLRASESYLEKKLARLPFSLAEAQREIIRQAAPIVEDFALAAVAETEETIAQTQDLQKAAWAEMNVPRGEA